MPSNARECRKHAVRCAELAIKAHSPELAMTLTTLSKNWMKLAADLSARSAHEGTSAAGRDREAGVGPPQLTASSPQSHAEITGRLGTSRAEGMLKGRERRSRPASWPCRSPLRAAPQESCVELERLAGRLPSAEILHPAPPQRHRTPVRAAKLGGTGAELSHRPCGWPPRRRG